MRISPRLAPLGLILALAACAKDSRNNSAWVAVKNETGVRLNDFVLDYGAGQRRYQIFEAGYTFGGYVRVRGRQSISITYTDGDGVRRAPDPRLTLTPDLIGDRVLLTLKPDRSVELRVDEVTKRRPSPFNGLEDYERWFQGAAALVLVPLLILGLRKLRQGATAARTAVKAFFANPARDGAVAALGLTYKVCPVRMFTNDPSDPTWWYEGASEGKTLGLLEHGCLWLGGPDEATMLAFARGPDGVLAPDDFFEGDEHPIRRDAELLAILSRFSSAVESVGLLAEAVEVRFEWKGATAESIVSDAKLLPAVRARVVAYDPPLVRAVIEGDAKAVAALLDGGVDLEAMTFGHLNAVTAAALKDRADLLRLLLAAGAKPLPKYGRPLHLAAALGHLDVVRAFIESGVAADQHDGYGTALIAAAANGREAVVAFLLERGADPNALNADRGTALGYAKHGKHERVIALLKAAGAS